MANLSMEGLDTRQRYWLITGSVGPRPIGLVTTLSAEGRCNAAPFSAFNYLSEDPALMVIGIDRYGDESHRPGERKDTLTHIVGRGEFVVNMVDAPMLDRAVRCGTDYPAHRSELEAVGFEAAPSVTVGVPRIAEAPMAWECRLFRLLEYGAQRSLVLGEIVGLYLRDDLLDAERMRVRVDRFHPMGRLGGPTYCSTRDRRVVRAPAFDGAGKPRV